MPVNKVCGLLLSLCACTGVIGEAGVGGSGPAPTGGWSPDAPAPGTTMPGTTTPGNTAPQTPGASDPPLDPMELPTPDECSTAVFDAARGRWRRLTVTQYVQSVRDLLGVSPDTEPFLDDIASGLSPFVSNTSVQPQALDIDNYWAASEEVVEQVDLGALLSGCVAWDRGCAEAFIDGFGRRAFRRPLSDEQRVGLWAVYQAGAEEGFDAGIRLVIQAALNSPEFLYQTELGTPVREEEGTLYTLDAWELATRLSFLLWNTTPDDRLLDAAGAGALDTPAGLAAEAERLMQSPRFSETLEAFHLALAGVTRIDDVTRAEPELTDVVRAAMVEDARVYLRQVMQRGATVAGVFTAPIEPSGALEAIYQEGEPARHGLLSLPAVLVASPPIETDFAPTYRGASVRKYLLCDPVPPPAFAVEFEGSEEGLSSRERLRQHKDNPGCAACHELMDPIGFALETYDDLGRFRELDSDGMPIDASGYVRLTDETLEVEGPDSLSRTLGAIPEVRACMAVQWFRYALARDPTGRDACSLSPVVEVLQSGAGDIRGAVRALVTSDAFRLRRGD